MSKSGPHQDELALSSVAAHGLFPGRRSLYVHEVAGALQMTEQQVIDLIQEHTDTDGKSGLCAINIGNTAGNKSGRKFWRIPVSAYDAFIAARKSS